jgi:hypothetical protein
MDAFYILIALATIIAVVAIRWESRYTERKLRTYQPKPRRRFFG